jgi:hypothetical protein
LWVEEKSGILREGGKREKRKENKEGTDSSAL